MAALKLGVLGGTFDPVHVGHLVLAEQAREQLGLTRVLWVPAGDPWRKSEGAVTEARHRVEMVRLAIADHAAFELCGLEVERPGPTYTVDTLEALRAERADSELVLLLGQDALEDLPSWREPRRIAELATLAVAGRAAQADAQGLERVLPGSRGGVVRIDMPRVDVSSTDLRQRAGAGKSLRYLVPAEVDEYIRRHGLYQHGG
ncbi:MAG: nicotinate-nucleotide adenylyltransferase [Dehalococcoidia bacterium]|nr:nicotinate-nucleotide adenylyltransferase [Dehalococcoidia bacterium]